MEKQNLKYVEGRVVTGQPADIYFYDDVDRWNCNDFLAEFDWLIECMPSKIRIHINSCGGSVVDGIGVFSKIIDCKIPTECVVDGIAASMGSVIWAAGDDVYMKDYALLMIHNPFIESNGTKAQNKITEAFSKQLKTIYTKRFNFDEDKIKNIMDGLPGDDGTFFTAAEAVENGFLPQDHVIVTPLAERNQIEAALNGEKNMAKIKAIMDLAVINKNTQAINEKDKNNLSTEQKMEKNEMTVFAALLGMNSEKATVDSVTASIKDLQNKANEYDTLKASFEALKTEHSNMETEFAASKASVQNLTSDLKKASDELKKYQDAERAAFSAKVEALVDGAIESCKINKEDKESWVEMAKNNFDLAKKALDSIPSREKLVDSINEGTEEQVKDDMKSEEEKIFAKVEEVVGKGFKFRSMD